MQTVSSDLLTILSRRHRDLAAVVEFYHFDAQPGADGFDPQSSDFLLGFTDTTEIDFRTRKYYRRVKTFGEIKVKISQEFSTGSVTLDNHDRSIGAFELSTGFEGLIMVVRLMSRSLAPANDLADTIVLFVGRCEQPDSFDRSSESVQIQAKQIVSSIDLQIPRRKFTPDDEDGRHPSDPLFEGFRFYVTSGTVPYQVREKRGGILGMLGFKKTSTRYLPYSSHSDLDAERAVSLAFGRVQVPGMHIAYADRGTYIEATTAVLEGEIKAFINARSVTPGFTINSIDYRYGLLGGTGSQVPNGSPTFAGSGYYSRLAYFYSAIHGTQAQQDDPAPEIAALVLASKVPLPDPDNSNEFTLNDWTDNPVYITRFLLSSQDFWRLGDNFIEDAETLESGAVCDELLLDMSGTDSIALLDDEDGLAGSDYQIYLPTSTATVEYFKLLAGLAGTDAEKEAPFSKEADYQFFTLPELPIEPPDRGPGGGTGPVAPGFTLRRRYTCNVVISEQHKIVDFLFKVLFPSARIYLTQTAKGKVAIRVAKPVDTTYVLDSSSVGANQIAVFDVEPWRDSTIGYVLVGANLATGELRAVTDANYTTASNSITLAGTNLTVSGATLTGANNADNTASGTVTVPNTTGPKSLVINGYEISYAPRMGDTIETIAGFLWGAVRAHPVLQKYIRAEWSGAVVTLYSKLGSLALDSALANAHSQGIASPSTAPTIAAAAGGNLGAGNWKVSYSYRTALGETLSSAHAAVTLTANQKINVTGVTPPVGASVNWYCSVAGGTTLRLRRVFSNDGSGFTIDAADLPNLNSPPEPLYNSTAEEILRVRYSFTDAGSVQVAQASSNVLRSTFKWGPMNRDKSINRVDLKFRDSVRDFKLTELRIKDSEHINRVKKVNPKEVRGDCIDNFHQARRIANAELALARDGNLYTALGADGEALLLEEGDVVCVTDSSGGFVNLPVRIEDKNIAVSNGNAKANFVARRYQSSFYDDDVTEKTLPIPTTLKFPRMGSKEQGIIATADSTIYAAFTKVDSAFSTTQKLPDAAALAGKEFTIKNVGAGNVTLDTSAGQTIFTSSAVASITVETGEAYTVRSDGANWMVI